MATFKQQINAASAASDIEQYGRAIKSTMFDTLDKVVKDVGELSRKRFELDQTILRERALDQFSIGMTTIENTAQLNPQNGSSYISDQSNRLLSEIKSAFGDVNLGAEFDIKADKVKTNAIIRHNLYINRGLNKYTIKSARDASLDIALNANLSTPEEIDVSLGNIRDKTTSVFGAEIADVNYQNAKHVAESRHNIAVEGEGKQPQNVPQTDILPIIPNQLDESLRLNSNITTNQIRASIENPMLARGFQRIQHLTSENALILAQEIKKRYPDSPEPEAIELANNLRSQGIRTNPLEYGYNQLFYDLQLHDNNMFVSSEDERFKAASIALQNFNNTNFLTTKEREALKTLPIDARVNTFFRMNEKLKAYNTYASNESKIDSMYAYNEMQAIDKDAYNIFVLKSTFPQFDSLSSASIQAARDNLKGRPDADQFRINISDQLLSVPNIKSFLEMANSADIALHGISDINKLYDSSNVFSIQDNYAYLKKYANGHSFQDTARMVLKDNRIKLRNTDIDVYTAYNPDGTPVIINNKPVSFAGDFLNSWKMTEQSIPESPQFEWNFNKYFTYYR